MSEKTYPKAWKVLTNVSTEELEAVLNKAAYEGYRVHRMDKNDSMVFQVWNIILFNPAFITNRNDHDNYSKRAMGDKW